MEQTWRWWGPEDSIPLAHVAQAGATGLVTALHGIPTGTLWPVEAIRERLRFIEEAGFGQRWSVVESLPIPEAIKIGDGDLALLFDTYRQSMRNLAACGVTTICYNFMPVLDWTRTDLKAPVHGGGTALRFNQHEFAAFELFILKREGAEAEYAPTIVERAHAWFDDASEDSKRKLVANISAGLPGAFDRYDVESMRGMLARYRDIGPERLRENLARFLREVGPLAEEVGIRLAIHPDDPPRPLLGLPRVVSREEDLAFILDAYDSPANGLTFCTGSLGASPHNDLPAMAERFADRIHFAHLRNVTKDPDGSFEEADHLAGDTDMVRIVEILLTEQKRRRDAGDPRWRIPFRPDHGHELLNDLEGSHFPGYSAIGRLRGLAEIRGVMTACAQLRGLPT